jgi:hypothetical protein
VGLFFRNPEVKTEFKRPPRSQALNAPRGLTASAVQVNLKKANEVDLFKRRLESGKKWQRDAYDYTELIGEVQFAANMVANTVSKIRLFPGYITANDTAPSDIFDIPDDQASPELKKAAYETLRLLSTGDGGIPGILRDAALNLFIAGECFLVKEPAAPGALFPQDVWQIRSVEEIVVKDGRNGTKDVFIKGARDDTDADLIPLGSYHTTFIGRIWRPNPRFSREADSSLRPQLENCDMVLLYQREKKVIVKSRIPAGILFLPDGLSASAASDGELEDPLDLEDGERAAAIDDDEEFEESLIAALTDPITDENAYASVVPPIIRGAGELGAMIRHISFARQLDPQISADAERTLQRVLLGLDLPKEIVAGLTDSKYANAVVVEDNFYKSHIEPMILSIVDAFTVLLMRTVLTSMGFSQEEVSRVVVWYDPSPVSTKPDKATAATTGYEFGILSADAWRRYHGFADTDKPSGLERIQRLAESKGLLSEPVTEAALRSIEPKLFDQIRAAQSAQTDPETAEAVDQALSGQPTDAPAEETPEAPAEPQQPAVPLIEP